MILNKKILMTLNKKVLMILNKRFDDFKEDLREVKGELKNS